MAQPAGGHQRGAWRAQPGLRASLGPDPCAHTGVLTVLGPSEVQSGSAVGEGGGRAAAAAAGSSVARQEQVLLMPGQGRKSRVLVPVPGSMRVQCPWGTHSAGHCWRRPCQWGPGDTRDPALPLRLTWSVPAYAPNCPQSLQPGMGPGVAPGGPGQRNRRNNVPMRTSAFYFLPTMFSWQTRHSHDRRLGSKPRGQHDGHHRNTELNTNTALPGTCLQLTPPALGTRRLWSTVPPGLSPTVHGSTGLQGSRCHCLPPTAPSPCPTVAMLAQGA